MQPPCISSHQSLMSKWTLGLSCRCRLVTECIDLSRDCPFLSKLVKPFSPSMRSQFPPSLKVEELFLAVPVCMKHPNQKFSHALSIVATTPSTTEKTTIRCLKGRTRPRRMSQSAHVRFAKQSLPVACICMGAGAPTIPPNRICLAC